MSELVVRDLLNLPPDDPRMRTIAIVEALPEGCARTVADVHLRLEVRGKKFGWYMENHHGDGRLQINCKAPMGLSQELAERNPAVYHIPKYVGKKGWIGIWVDVPGVDWNEVADYLALAHSMTAPKSLLNRL